VPSIVTRSYRKSEARNPKQIRNPKIQNKRDRARFGFRASDLFRISDFVLRIFTVAPALLDPSIPAMMEIYP
jgi:hypothetical protein